MTSELPRCGDRGAGLIGTIGGVTVVLMFLLFAVQLLVGLYANTTVLAVATDAAQRAAGRDADRSERALEQYAQDAQAGLRGVKGRVDFEGSFDETGDGELDVIVVTVTARSPNFVPGFLGVNLGVERISKTVVVEVEKFVGASP